MTYATIGGASANAQSYTAADYERMRHAHAASDLACLSKPAASTIEIRSRAIELAHGVNGLTPEEVVARAGIYEAFLLGKTTSGGI